MASKSALIAAVGAVSVLSVGTGTFLAFRANQTPTAAVETSVTTSPAPDPATTSAAQVASTAGSQLNSPMTASRLTVAEGRNPAAPPLERRAVESAPKPAPVPSPAATPEPAAPTVTAVLPPTVTDPPVTSAVSTTTAVEPPPVQDPPKPRFEEIRIKQGSVVGIKLDQSVSSETARVEDRVTAKVTRDVTVDGRTAIAAGTKLEGVVTQVERGGKFRERSRLAIRFNTLILADGLRVPIQTDAILREGDSPSGEAGSKIGASAVAGAILGGLIGGKRGAVIGSTAGAAGGTAAVAGGGRNAAVIQGGSPLTVLLTAPVAIMIERELQGS